MPPQLYATTTCGRKFRICFSKCDVSNSIVLFTAHVYQLITPRMHLSLPIFFSIHKIKIKGIAEQSKIMSSSSHWKHLWKEEDYTSILRVEIYVLGKQRPRWWGIRLKVRREEDRKGWSRWNKFHPMEFQEYRTNLRPKVSEVNLKKKVDFLVTKCYTHRGIKINKKLIEMLTRSRAPSSARKMEW